MGNIFPKMSSEDIRAYKPPAKRCELCVHYGMIDSGYGYCRRYPPTLIRVKLVPLKYDYRYPEVPWCAVGCGEFQKGS